MTQEILRDTLERRIEHRAERFRTAHPILAGLLSRLAARLKRAATPDPDPDVRIPGPEDGIAPAHGPMAVPDRTLLTPEEFERADGFYALLLDALAKYEISPERGLLEMGESPFPPPRTVSAIKRTPEGLIEFCKLKSEWDALPVDLKEGVVAQMFRDFNFAPSCLGKFGYMKGAAAPGLIGRSRAHASTTPEPESPPPDA